MKYKSNAMQCNDDDPFCAVCRFLNGDRSAFILMQVIDLLDTRLAGSKTLNDALIQALIKIKKMSTLQRESLNPSKN